MNPEISFQPNKEIADLILAGLVEYNNGFLPDRDLLDFTCVLKDDSNQIMGGLVGKVLIQTAHVNYFWLSEAHRKKGYGKIIFEALEKEARKRNLDNITLDTYSFQAPGFYEKMGFKNTGQYTNSPIKGVNKIFFQKHLSDN